MIEGRISAEAAQEFDHFPGVHIVKWRVSVDIQRIWICPVFQEQTHHFACIYKDGAMQCSFTGARQINLSSMFQQPLRPLVVPGERRLFEWPSSARIDFIDLRSAALHEQS